MVGAFLEPGPRLALWLAGLLVDVAAPRFEFRFPGLGAAPMHFHAALRLAAKNDNTKVPDGTRIDTEVGIGPDKTSFGLAVMLTGYLPGLDQHTADELMRQAHHLCPYSKVTRGNLDVALRSIV